MKTTIVFILLLSQLVRGDASYETTLPYQVAVEVKGDFKCSGAIISVFWVLSIASAIENVTPDELIIRAASPPRWRGVVHRIQEVVIHPQHQEDHLEANFSLLKLRTRLVFSSRIHPITLWPVVPSYMSKGRVTGWIHDQDTNKSRTKSKVFDISVESLDPSLCGANSSRVLICISHSLDHSLKYNQETNGDLLIMSNRLAGFLLRQANQSISIFSAVGPYIKWINRSAFRLGR